MKIQTKLMPKLKHIKTLMPKQTPIQQLTPKPKPTQIQKLTPTHFLIVDDVFTTGATLEAAVHALRSSPTLADCRVSIATLAYVE